ncbi:MAG: hypothetical protein MJ103_03965 [Saccharofermentans sp.]|nr:hypothetical protein [Saccharofermentans sp.]
MSMNLNLFEQYADLVLELDEVSKTCKYNDCLYGKYLADIMLYQSQISREYIRKSSMLLFCNGAAKISSPINVSVMSKITNSVLKGYDEYLKLMKSELSEIEAFTPSTHSDIKNSYEVYKRIGRLLHPKINELSLTDADMAFIWAKVAAAYAANDWKALMFLEERAIRTLREQGVDISMITVDVDEKTVEHLRQEVEELKASEDYLLGEKLDSEEWIDAERTRLMNESKAVEKMIESMNEGLRTVMTSGVKMVLE